MKRSLCSVVFALSLALILSACGGGGGTSQVTAPATAGTPSVAAKTSALAVGDVDCPSGGILVETGVDSNKNNTLDADEISKSQKVCNGTPGTAGTQGTAGLPGATGTTGTQGTNGTDGLNALVKLSQEAAGANCLTGGVRIDSGMDTSKNGVLDTSEITSTSYSCNGATGAAGPGGSGVTWVDVTGTSQQAVSNTGYMADSLSQVTITLPASPALGDTVQVTGVGTGGWKISQNPGQTIIHKGLFGTPDVWSAQGVPRSWLSVASSADGTKLVATAVNDYIYTSTDSGATWTPRDSVRYWNFVASSSDGSKLVATTGDTSTGSITAGMIYTSTDSGVTWIPRGATNRVWRSVASSSDGTKLAATTVNDYIYTSTDSGVTWTAHDSARYWGSVASSSDGTKLVATEEGISGSSGGLIYTSTDSGATWIPRGLTKPWFSVASSSDGTKLVATEQGISGSSGGLIYTSTDSGVTWIPRGLNKPWFSVASSSDGTKLVATTILDYIYRSSDSGVTWTTSGSSKISSFSVASSSDGTKLVAAAIATVGATEYVYTYQEKIFNIYGNQYDAIELQCVGYNVFTVLSYSGSVSLK